MKPACSKPPVVDDKRRKGAALGPLGGLPVIIRDNVIGQHAPVAQRLFEQGAVFFGKANMHELAGGGTCSNPATGFVGNPYDPGRVPGGSSGGTAAAIAAR